MNNVMNNQVDNSSIPLSEPQIVYAHYQPPYEDNEINLLEIWRVLVQKKRLLVGITLAVTLVASAYAFLAPPFYKAEVFLLPPQTKNIQGLNVQALNINGHSPASVYNLFVRNLHSRAFRMRLFKEQNLADLLAPDRDHNTRIEDIFESTFNQALTVSQNLRKKGQEDFVTVSFETRDATLSANILNDFIRLVNAKTISSFAQGVEEKLNSRKQLLQNKIASKRARLRSENRIQVLEDVVFVDEVLIDYSSLPIQATTTNDDLRDYLVLQHKLEQLSALGKLKEQLVLLENITLNRDSMTAVTIDQWAISPKTPAKPKRLLIIAISFILSLMMGVFFVFFLNTLEQQREQPELKSS